MVPPLPASYCDRTPLAMFGFRYRAHFLCIISVGAPYQREGRLGQEKCLV